MEQDSSAKDTSAQDIAAALIFARHVGRMFASRVLSFLGLAGGIGLGFYVSWAQNWYAVAAFAVYAFIFTICVRSEDRGRDAMRGL